MQENCICVLPLYTLLGMKASILNYETTLSVGVGLVMTDICPLHYTLCPKKKLVRYETKKIQVQ